MKANNLPARAVYFIFVTDYEKQYIFKNNILRFRLAKDNTGNSDYYLRITFKGGDSMGFYLSEENAVIFENDQPNPGPIKVSIPKSLKSAIK